MQSLVVVINCMSLLTGLCLAAAYEILGKRKKNHSKPKCNTVSNMQNTSKSRKTFKLYNTSTLCHREGLTSQLLQAKMQCQEAYSCSFTYSTK